MNFVLITQLGISMLVPVFLLLALGIYLENKFDIYATLPCIILGVLAGCRNTYYLAKKAVVKSQGEQESKEEQKIVNDAVREWNNGRQFTGTGKEDIGNAGGSSTGNGDTDAKSTRTETKEKK